MSLSVIGAGFGRTGTLSMKSALETLGLGRCYHMMEVFQNQSHPAQWTAAANGETVDFKELLTGYGARDIARTDGFRSAWSAIHIVIEDDRERKAAASAS